MSWIVKAARALALAVLMAVSCLPLFASAQLKVSPPGDGGPGRLSGKLLIVGSGTMAPMVAAIARRFEMLHPGVAIEVRPLGSGRGLSDIRQGKADIGMVSRALSDKENDVYGIAIARDGVCIIVHKDNPIRALTDQQVVGIYTGKITNWQQVGGADAPITVFNAEAGRSSPELFAHYFNIGYGDIKAERVIAVNSERIKAIADNRNATIYMSVGEAERTALAGAPIKLLPVNGVAPTSRNIRTGNFPISRGLLLITADVPAGLAKDFINFSLSPHVTEIVKQHDFVPYLD